MLFLFFTETALILVIIFISIKFNTYKLDMNELFVSNGNLWLYFIPKHLPLFFYYQNVIMGIRIGTIAACGFFVLPLMLLILVQVKNFCSAKTTNERFSRKKPVGPAETTRQSSESSDSLNGKLLEEDDHEANKKVVHTKRGGCLANCWEM